MTTELEPEANLADGRAPGEGPANDGPSPADPASRLESLPPEVRRQILCSLDPGRLTALTRASPTFYQQYLADRSLITRHCLIRELGPVCIDAYYACTLSLPADQGQDQGEGEPNLFELLESYTDSLEERHQAGAIDSLIQKHVASIYTHYLCVVKPITELFAHWLLGDLAAQTSTVSAGSKLGQELSLTEWRRLVRAVYRFEVLCRITKPWDYYDMQRRVAGTTGTHTRRYNREALISVLLDGLNPWEVEELVCCVKYVYGVYDKAIRDVEWDLHPDNPKFADQGRPPTPDGAVDLSNDWYRETHIEGTALNGLGLLHTILCGIRNHEHLVSTIQGRIAHEYIPFNSFTGPFGLTDQEVRVRDTPSEHDFLMCCRTPMPFLGDADADSPPWAWTSMWDETYSSFYGWYMPEEAQRFGYVFWDADRLKLTGADGLLKEYWSDQWDRDPRHEFLDRYGPMEDWM